MMSDDVSVTADDGDWEEESVSASESQSSWVTTDTSVSDLDVAKLTKPGAPPHKPARLQKGTPGVSRFARPKAPIDPCQEIHAKLERKCSFAVSMKSVRHIWNCHGNYQNAKREQLRKKRKGKIPSHFANRKALIKGIYLTGLRPNWTRLAHNPRKRGKNYMKNKKKRMKRLQAKGRKVPVLNVDEARNDTGQRTFSFKKFKVAIGYSGRGYSKDKTTENVECRCCGVLVDSVKGLVTAFPMITEDAKVKGVGSKSHYTDDSSSISIDEIEQAARRLCDYTDTSIMTSDTSSRLSDVTEETDPTDNQNTDTGSS